jgi:DNA repair and recombination protein RAD52
MTLNAKQVAELQAPLDRKAVKTRSQAGRSLSYIEGWHAIAEANRIFGFDGWHRETLDLRPVCEPTQNAKGNWVVSYMAKVRVTVGTIIREGCGFGSGFDKDIGQAHESALKEAETDAMKRALMTFGNPFGLALYDKDQTNVTDGQPTPNGRMQDALNVTTDDRRQAAEDWTEQAIKRFETAATAKEIMAWHDKPAVNAFLRKMRDDDNLSDLFAVISLKMEEALATKPKE